VPWSINQTGLSSGSSRMSQAGPPWVHWLGSSRMFHAINQVGFFTSGHPRCPRSNLRYTGSVHLGCSGNFPTRYLRNIVTRLQCQTLLSGLALCSVPCCCCRHCHWRRRHHCHCSWCWCGVWDAVSGQPLFFIVCRVATVVTLETHR
jgi:hypothetical protein